MKKIFAILYITCLTAHVNAQSFEANVSGMLFNTESDSVFISQFYGQGYKNFIGAKLNKKGEYHLKGMLPVGDYYVFRTGKNTHVNLIIADKTPIKVHGDGKNIANSSNIIGSDASVNLRTYINQQGLYNQKKDSVIAMMKQDPSRQKELDQSFQTTYYQFQATRQSFVQNNPNSPALIACLSSFDINTEFDQYESIMLQLKTGFSQSPSVQQMLTQYENFKKQKEMQQLIAIGKPAPEIELQNPDGKTIKLSELKGKVVLVDFWASWCKPCRNANPGVVKMYEKYKDQGFTVYSVSLDSDKAAWVKAIAADNLSWPNHVIDVKNTATPSAGSVYGAQYIPYTVLIDANGIIIDVNTKGDPLYDLITKTVEKK